MTARAITLFAVLVAVGASGCGGDDDPPPPRYTLTIQLSSVIPIAIEELRLAFQPQGAGDVFAPQEPASHEGGNITTGVTADGQYVVTANAEYVAEHGRIAPDGFSDLIDFELFATNMDPSQTIVMDPVVSATANRRGEIIASGTRFVQWPLPEGGGSMLTLRCLAGFMFQCRNEEPPAGVDAGPPGDGG